MYFLILVLSDFYEVPLVKQYILHILIYCIFDQYLTRFGKLPKLVVDKIHTSIKIKKYWNSSNNCNEELLCSSKEETDYIYIYLTNLVLLN